jgi:hypothetical protein
MDTSGAVATQQPGYWLMQDKIRYEHYSSRTELAYVIGRADDTRITYRHLQIELEISLWVNLSRRWRH